MTRTNQRGRSGVSRAGLVLLGILLFFFITSVDGAAQKRRSGSQVNRRGANERRATSTKSKKKNPERARTPQRRRSEPAVRHEPRQDVVSPPEEDDRLIVVDPAAETIMRVTEGDQAYDKAPLRNSLPLSPEALQTLGRREREVARIPPRPYPDISGRFPRAAPLYADLRLGLYSTVAINAGLVGSSWPYDYSIELDGSTTQGSEENATAGGFGCSAEGGYVIDNGYGIFSGGHMGGGFDYRQRSYALYAEASAPDREYDGWGLFLNGDNTYLDNSFRLRGGYRAFALDDVDGPDRRETVLEGSAAIETKWLGLQAECEADLELATYNGTSLPYGAIRAGLAYKASGFSLFGGAGFSVAENSDASSGSRFSPMARLAVTPFNGVVLLAGVTGGIQTASVKRMIDVNPYAMTSQNGILRHEDETIGIRGELNIDAGGGEALHLYGGHSRYESYLFFARPESGRFAPHYGAATLFQTGGDFTLRFDKRNRMTGEVRFAELTLDSSGGTVPYAPRWYASATYSHQLGEAPLTIIAGGKYVGERRNGDGQLQDQAILLSLEARYPLFSTLEATLAFSNLLDEQYEVWQGYRERGIYAAVGATFRY